MYSWYCLHKTAFHYINTCRKPSGFRRDGLVQ